VVDLRLFGPARQAAGVARADVPGGSVADVLAEAARRYGSGFAEAVSYTHLAIVTFCGTVRDHSDGRPGVTELEYEVFPEHADSRLHQLAGTARRRWPMIGNLVILHRVGRLSVGEVSVVVVASTPHRAEAFDAARYCIDTLKRTIPIWKRETWAGGNDWSTCAHRCV